MNLRRVNDEIAIISSQGITNKVVINKIEWWCYRFSKVDFTTRTRGIVWRCVLALVLLLAPVLAQATPMFLLVETGNQTVFCGVEEVGLVWKSRRMELDTPFGVLNLKVKKKRYGQYDSYKCLDQNGNVYFVTAIKVDGGTGLIFEPENDVLPLYTIANASLCD